MSAFNQAGNVDARHGIHYQTNITANCYCLLPGFFTADSRQTVGNIQDNYSKELSRPTLPNGLKSQLGIGAKNCHSSDALAVFGTAVGLIAQLTEGLIRRGDPSNNQLGSLKQTLSQLSFAIQVYRGRPLGQSLANTITPEVKQCVDLLQELIDMVNDPCCQFLQKPLNEREVALTRDLSFRQTSLDGLLIALHSYASFISDS
jgi:hypothetical protein